MTDLLPLSPASPATLLTEKFRPRAIDQFLGLEKPKRVCSKLCANPFSAALLFTGDSGLGKTALALAMADQMPAELHHVPSQDCNLQRLRDVIAQCHYVPRAGCKMHLVLIDEGDQMTAAAQLYLLSKLDATDFPPQTIFVITCNATDGLEKRFLSRCIQVEFSSYGTAKEAAALLERVWDAEAPQGADRPNFARIVKDACGNVRAALMALQNELLLA